jgi:NADH-quinone oxidoreductase subunit N
MNLTVVLPELALLVGACVVLLADAFGSRRSGEGTFRVEPLALAALVPPFVAILFTGSDGGVRYAFGEMVVSDLFGDVLKVCAILATGAAMIYGRRYVQDRDIHRGELYSLALFSLLGQMVMISGSNLLVLYLGLELMSLSLYALAAIRRESIPATEAAMKYFVLGALSSGFLLYGMSMIYGATGSLDITDIARAIAGGSVSNGVLAFGLVFLVAGLAFKLGAVPFHMWLPDVYHGTPTLSTLLIAGGPKLAAFALAFRLLGEALMSTSNHWHLMLMVLAVLSLALGNLAAIAQTNLKRMLAYSAIGQIGFVLLGLLASHGTDPRFASTGFSSAMFYAITYVLTTLGTFGVIQLIARRGLEADQISDLAGLGKRSPWMAGAMLAMMFSLTGIPPFVGFYAKLAVLQAVVGLGLVWLAVFAVMMSLVGAFYYLRIVKVMYFDEPTDPTPLVPRTDASTVMAVNGLLLLLLGILPGPLMNLCIAAVRQAMQLG